MNEGVTWVSLLRGRKEAIQRKLITTKLARDMLSMFMLLIFPFFTVHGGFPNFGNVVILLSQKFLGIFHIGISGIEYQSL